MSYDQWKTASPYDDELDMVEECAKFGNKLSDLLIHFEDLRISELQDLLTESSERFIEVAIWIEENV